MSRRKTFQLEVSWLGNGTGAGKGSRGSRAAGSSSREGKLLRVARSIAEDVATRSALRVCTVDDVLAELSKHGIHPVDLGSSLGNVFRTRQWEATPWRAWSERRDGRRRLVRVWWLSGERSRPWVNDPRATRAW